MLLSFEANSQRVWKRETGASSRLFVLNFFWEWLILQRRAILGKQQFRGFLRVSDLGTAQNGKADGLLKGKDIITAFGRVGRLAMHGG